MNETKHSEGEGIQEEETLLCPSCLQPNPPDARFCSRCDAPLSAGAVLGPFEQTRAQRFIFHRAATGPSSLMVLLGIWVIFAPISIVCLVAIGTLLIVGPITTESLLESILPLFIAAFSTALVWKVSSNYRSRRQNDRKEDVA